MTKTFTMELAGRTLRVDVGRGSTGKWCSIHPVW